ncbi:MAG: hypothetical protein AUK47_20470 [Deltaproteobacteria bacterium CG2_30_63_29]|nr:MAG: hypothetical protein AUK47_20470 [Deltaproteobacteria bacterium CG2_30_63_29]PJB43676.1 MAG: hypothetical protein CO108_09785 [Deltaproteobacteria bacterium CG_4_9_14_3_um_filter_63_12]
MNAEDESKLGVLIESFEKQVQIVAEGHGVLLRAIEGVGVELLRAIGEVRGELKGDISELKTDFSKLDDKVTKLDDKVTKLDERVTKLDDKVTKLDDRVTKLDDKVTKLDDRVTKLDDRVTKLDGKLDSTRDELCGEIRALGAQVEAHEAGLRGTA